MDLIEKTECNDIKEQWIVESKALRVLVQMD
jgi:hypothetical protein